MAPPASKSRPGTEPDGPEPHQPAERIALAASLCGSRGVQLTALRRQILELLWESRGPVGAYELMDALTVRTARAVGPPTVYRALEFLIAQGLVTKIETRNAFAPCAHPERRHDCLFFLCDECGASVELEDPWVEQRLAEDAGHFGFRVTRRVVEVAGTCRDCVTDPPIGASR
ncbi:MAG: Fur family transcriptional regulator [Pseudomonadota bacterium]